MCIRDSIGWPPSSAGDDPAGARAVEGYRPIRRAMQTIDDPRHRVPRSQAHLGHQGTQLLAAELPRLARPEVAEAHRSHLGADQPGDRVPDGREQPPHDPVATLVQHHLDQARRRGDVHDAVGVCLLYTSDAADE